MKQLFGAKPARSFLLLMSLDRRKPWDRRRRFRVGSWQELPVYDPEEG